MRQSVVRQTAMRQTVMRQTVMRQTVMRQTLTERATKQGMCSPGVTVSFPSSVAAAWGRSFELTI